jgi:hypothetical protein
VGGFDEDNTRTNDGEDMPEATCKPHEKHGRLTTQGDLPDSVYAFPKQRKEPLTDRQHVGNAVARFDQVIDVSDADRALAFPNIEKAAVITTSISRRRHSAIWAFICKRKHAPCCANAECEARNADSPLSTNTKVSSDTFVLLFTLFASGLIAITRDTR